MRRLLQRIVPALAAVIGWRVHIPVQPPPRCIIIGAPHTSNWDLLCTLLLTFTADLRLHWVGKASLFRGWKAPLMRALGGIPVERKRSQNFVACMVAAFDAGTPLRLALIPEGTRSKTDGWKTGFYYIALGAGVPIVLGYADYRGKVVGLGPTLQPSGDLKADFEFIRKFYQGIVGRHPERQGAIRLAVLDGSPDPGEDSQREV